MRVHLKGIVELFRWRLPCNDHQWYELFCYHHLTSMSLIVHYMRKRSQFPNYYKNILKRNCNIEYCCNLPMKFTRNLHRVDFKIEINHKTCENCKKQIFHFNRLCKLFAQNLNFYWSKSLRAIRIYNRKKKINYFFEKSPKNLPTNKKKNLISVEFW